MSLAPDEAVVRVVEARGATAPFPRLVSGDFRLVMDVEVSTSAARAGKRTTSSTTCARSVGVVVRARFTLDAAQFHAQPDAVCPTPE